MRVSRVFQMRRWGSVSQTEEVVWARKVRAGNFYRIKISPIWLEQKNKIVCEMRGGSVGYQDYGFLLRVTCMVECILSMWINIYIVFIIWFEYSD